MKKLKQNKLKTCICSRIKTCAYHALMKSREKIKRKEMRDFKGTFNRMDHCSNGCHHIYDDIGTPQNLKDLYKYISEMIDRLAR